MTAHAMTTGGGDSDPSRLDTAPRGRLLTRVCDTLRELRELTAERDDTLASAEIDRDGAIASVRMTFDRETTGAQTDLDATRSAAQEELRSELAEIAARYDERLKTLYAERARKRGDLEERVAQRLEGALKEHEEGRWLLTTVRDSDASQAHATARARLESADAIDAQIRDAEQARADLAEDLAIPGLASEEPEGKPSDDESGVEGALTFAQQRLEDARDFLDQLSSATLPKLTRGAGFWVFIASSILVSAAAAFVIDGYTLGTRLATSIGAGMGTGVAVSLVMRFVVRQIGDNRALARARASAQAVADARMASRGARADTESELKKRIDEIEEHAQRERDSIEQQLIKRREKYDGERAEREREIEAAYTPKIERMEAQRDDERANAERRASSIEEQAQAHFDTVTVGARTERDRAITDAERCAEDIRRSLDERWAEAQPRLRAECDRLHASGIRHAPAWDATAPNEEPTPPDSARIGWARWRVPEVAGGGALAWTGDRHIELPLSIEFPRVGSMLIEAPASERARALEMTRAVMLRLLTQIPPGKLRFTIVDPVGLGESFAAFMHLADHQEQLVSGRIWTEPRHIEQRLLDLTEHMESVIQKYLRNDYPTIEAYNRTAGEIAEPYRFLVIADFPTNITDASAKRIASIAAAGARCGVHTLIACDPSKPLPRALDLDELRKNALCFALEKEAPAQIRGLPTLEHAEIEIDAFPDDSRSRSLMQRVGELSVDAGRVQVPFGAVSPAPDDVWSASCSDALRIPVGRTGATKLQELVLGVGTAQHALIAGRTGSGKSTLFHVIVTSCAMRFSPDEVEMYLIDFKKGVEFKAYARHALPHARVIAIETDRAFGLSVLERIDHELTERGELMRASDTQDLKGYREKTGKPMPRVLLVVDEFQELFTEDDAIAQKAGLFLDRIVRQGRAFGVHVVLGSQTLGGAYALNRATMSQMNVRIALQCDEQDSYLILGEDNSAARLLERPGEAIYNGQGGRVEANSPFQIVWLPEHTRDEALERLSRHAERTGMSTHEPVVFEGNAPADPSRTPELVSDRRTPVRPSEVVPVHLGVPIAIAPPLSAGLERARAENVVFISTDTDGAHAMLATSLLGFSRFAASTPGAVAYVVHVEDPDRPDSLEDIAQRTGLDTRLYSTRQVGDALAELDAEIERRKLADRDEEPPVLFVIAGVQSCRDVKRSDGMSFGGFGDDEQAAASLPGDLLDGIVQRGPEVGVHVVLWADTLDAFERALDRRRLSDFSHRVLTQMNAMDSASILDSPEASRLPSRRGLYYNDRLVRSVTFRPYAFPTGMSGD